MIYWYRSPQREDHSAQTYVMPVPGGALVRVDTQMPLFGAGGESVGHSTSTHATFVPFPPAREPEERGRWNAWLQDMGVK